MQRFYSSKDLSNSSSAKTQRAAASRLCLPLYVSGRQASMVKNCTKQDASKAMLYMEHMHRCTLSYQVVRLLDPGQLRAGFFLAPEVCTPSP